MGTPAEQRIHHQVPVSKFHLEQLEHVTRKQVLQLHKSTAVTKSTHSARHPSWQMLPMI